MTTAPSDIVLTGAGGFLGSHLLPELLVAGHRVLAITSLMEADVRASLPSSVAADGLQIISPGMLFEEAGRFSGAVVLNCAFPRNGDGMAMAAGLDFIDSLLASSADTGAYGVVNVSSQSVYPAMRAAPAREGDALELDTPYAVAKRSVELLARAHLEGRVPCTSVRLASLIGPGFSQRVVNKMVRYALETGVIDVVRPAQIFDYMDVRDAASALTALAESDPAGWDEVYNLGSDDSRTLGEIASVVAEAVRTWGCSCEVRMAMDSAPVSSSALDASRFREACRWKPAYTLEDAIGEIVQQILAYDGQETRPSFV